MRIRPPAGEGDRGVGTLSGTVDPGFTGSDLTLAATVTSPTAEPGEDQAAGRSASWLTSVTTSADLAISMVAVDAPFLAGESAVWDIEIVNNGPSTARNVRLTNAVPDGLVGITLSGPDGVTCPPGQPCSIAALAPGEASAVTIRATGAIPPGHGSAPLDNLASVTSTTSDPQETNNVAGAVAPVNSAADLRLTVTAESAVALAGEQIRWTVLVSNDGPSTADGLMLTNLVPAELTDVSLAGPTGLECDDPAVCALGSLGPDTSLSFELTGVVPPDSTVAAVSTIASVATATHDPDPTNNGGTSQVLVGTAADVAISTTVPPGVVLAGDDISWTVTVSNAGPSTARGVSILALLPAGLLDVQVSSADLDCDDLPCAVGTLGAGDSIDLTIDATVSPNSAASSITTAVTVTSTSNDPNDSNNGATAVSAVQRSADLALSLATEDDSAIPGEELNYSITATNTGPSRADSVLVTAALPPSLLDPVASTTTGICEPIAAGMLSCSTATLDPDSVMVITVSGTVDPDVAGAPLVATAAVTSPTIDPDLSNDFATLTLPVTATADLVLTLESGQESVVAGESASWTLSVTNVGPAGATGVVLDADLPDGLTEVSVAESSDAEVRAADISENCLLVAGVLGCEVAELDAGETYRFTVAGVVSPTWRGPLVTVAEARSDLLDLRPTDNTSRNTVTVTAETALDVTKVAADNTVTAGDSVDYIITVTNAGPSAATEVSVTELLPDGAVVLDASSEDFDGSTAVWTVGTVLPDEPRTLTVTVRLDDSGTAVNTVRVASAEEPDGAVAAAEVEVLPATGIPTTPAGPTDPPISTDPTVTTDPTATAEPTAAPPGTPAPTGDDTAGPDLPNTGASVMGQFWWALLLVTAGLALVLTTRRRTSHHGEHG